MRIGGAGGCAQTRIRRDGDVSVCWQAETPLIPETGCAERELTVRGDPFGTFPVDCFLPVREPGRVSRATNGFQQNVQIVEVAEHILHTFQVCAPADVALGQKIFDDVTKMFYADAERVPRFWPLGAQSAAVQFGGFFEPFECEAMSGWGVRR